VTDSVSLRQVNFEVYFAFAFDRHEPGSPECSNNHSENCGSLPCIEDAHRLRTLAQICPGYRNKEKRLTVANTPGSSGYV
jgi:hypothetical protein